MKRISLIALLGAGIIFLAPSVNADNLVILHTNDTHSQIDPDTQDGLGGVLRRKAIFDSIRAAEKNVLVIDAGDVVQGTLYFNLYRGLVEEKAMNALGYDIRILGNHEFDNGIDSLAKYISMSEADLLATNYDLSRSALAGKFKPFIIKEVGDKKIGVIAINLNPKGMISDGNYDGVEYLDAVKAANAAAWWLKHIEKVDGVVAVTHIGYNPSTPPGDVDLGKLSEDIDIIIGGHSHTLVKPDAEGSEAKAWIENANGKPVLVTQAMKAGKYVGKIDIDLDNMKPSYELIKVDSRFDSKKSPELEAIIAPFRHGVDSLNHVKVGKIAVDMEKDSPELLNFASDLILRRGEELADDVDFAMVNKGGIRHGLKKGNLYEGEIISMMPFYNYVTVIDIKGKDLLPAIKQMAKVGGQGLAGDIEVEYSSSPLEIKKVLIDGDQLDPEKTYRMATIDYVAKGGDYMPTLANGKVVAKSQSVLYNDVLRFLKASKGKTTKPASILKMKNVNK